MKLHRFLIVALAIVALTGCVVPAPAPAAPTPAPASAAETPAPVQEAPAAVPVAVQTETLTANPWQWVSFTGATEQFDVAAPESYQLTFNADGTVVIVADCNRANGYYKSDDSSLTVQVGPATMALCPAGSRGEQFVKLLGFAAKYFFKGGNLYIDLLADGGAMTLAPGKEPVAQPSPFAAINFGAGIPLDPFFISLQGGGPVDASALDKACTGWVPTAPSVAFDFKGEINSERLKLFIYSDHDPTLVVKTPDGKFVCNDNTNPLLLDPTVIIEKPEAGTYSVWAGNRTQKGLVAGILAITAKPDVDLGTFRPGELVQRPTIPETLVAPQQDPGNAERLKQAMAELAATAPRVKPGDPDTKVEFVAEGRFSPITYLGGDLRCNGLIKLEATYVFSLTETIQNLRIFVEGNHDSNLIVKTPTDEPAYACNDDATSENFNPVVDLANPATGLYAVWVGRVNADEPVTGTLTITQSNRQPRALKDR